MISQLSNAVSTMSPRHLDVSKYYITVRECEKWFFASLPPSRFSPDSPFFYKKSKILKIPFCFSVSLIQSKANFVYKYTDLKRECFSFKVLAFNFRRSHFRRSSAPDDRTRIPNRASESPGVFKCHLCAKPRCVFSKHKVSGRSKRELNRILDNVHSKTTLFVGRTFLLFLIGVPTGKTNLSRYVDRRLSCKHDIETSYYSANAKSWSEEIPIGICAFVGLSYPTPKLSS